MIREVCKEDIDACVQVIRESFLTVATEFGFTKNNAPRFTAFAINKDRLDFQLNIEQRPMYVYCDRERIVGYYSIQYQVNNECELSNLCVIPEYRHKKIGEQLLDHAFEQARNNNCKKMNIGIVDDNKKIRIWYEVHGFVYTGSVKYEFFPFTCGYMKREL